MGDDFSNVLNLPEKIEKFITKDVTIDKTLDDPIEFDQDEIIGHVKRILNPEKENENFGNLESTDMDDFYKEQSNDDIMENLLKAVSLENESENVGPTSALMAQMGLN